MFGGVWGGTLPCDGVVVAGPGAGDWNGGERDDEFVVCACPDTLSRGRRGRGAGRGRGDSGLGGG